MPETPPTPPPEQPPAPTPGTPPPTTPPQQPAAAGIPKERFDEVNSAKQQAERERDALKQQLQEREDAEKTELQKAQDAAAREKAAREAAESSLVKTKRQFALGAAARDAGALSADAVVALAEARGLDVDPDKPETVTAAIDALKESDAALFGQQAQAQPTSFGLPSVPAPAPNGGTVNTDDPKLGMGQGILAQLARQGLVKQ